MQMTKTFRMNANVFGQACNRARLEGRSMTDLVEEAIRTYLRYAPDIEEQFDFPASTRFLVGGSQRRNRPAAQLSVVDGGLAVTDPEIPDSVRNPDRVQGHRIDPQGPALRTQ